MRPKAELDEAQYSGGFMLSVVIKDHWRPKEDKSGG